MANFITAIRIICGVVVLFFPAFSKWFYMIYLLGGFTDAIDGTVARKLGQTSAFGARLDTIADVVFVLAVLIKLVKAVHFPGWVLIWIAVIALIRATNIIIGFFRHHHFVADHSVMNRICGVLLFFAPIYLGIYEWRQTMPAVVVTCILATFASIQEGFHIIAKKGKEQDTEYV